jgi:hypothetical protein
VYKKHWRPERQSPHRGGSIKQNENFEKSQQIKGRSEKLKKPAAILSWSLDLLSMALSRQLFCETVPLKESRKISLAIISWM